MKTRFQQYEIAPPGAPKMTVQIVEFVPGGSAMVGTRVEGETKWRTSGYESFDAALQVWGQR